MKFRQSLNLSIDLSVPSNRSAKPKANLKHKEAKLQHIVILSEGVHY